jgi:hypothetical protein
MPSSSTIYLLACCLVTIILASLLLPLGEVFNIVFAAAAAAFVIVFGRWLFGRKNLQLHPQRWTREARRL